MMFDRKEEGRYWDFGWQLVEGCTRIADGCKHCWSLDKERRFRKETGVVCHTERLDRPLKRRKPTSYAVWNDLFHEEVTAEFIHKALAFMALCPQHIFMILTKRPQRALDILSRFYGTRDGVKWPFDNVWLGTSCSGPDDLWMIEILLKISAAVHFVSFEPLLENIDALKYLWLRQKCVGRKGCGFTGPSYEFRNAQKDGAYRCPQCGKNHTYLVTDSLDWAIIGAESGPKRRFCKVEHVRNLVGQCDSARVPVFVKPRKKPDAEWPEDLQICREYPVGDE